MQLVFLLLLLPAAASGLRPFSPLRPTTIGNANNLAKERSFSRFSSNLERNSSPLSSAVSSLEEPRGGGATTKKSRFWTRSLCRELLAEAVGTFIIVQLGTGAVMSAIFTDSLVGLFQIAAVWIIAVTLAIACTASISGAHLNPAISLSLALWRPSPQFGWSKLLPYAAAQTVGAVVASATNYVLYKSQIAAFEAAHGIVRSSSSSIASAKAFGEYFGAPVTTLQAFLAEAVGTAILAGVVFALTHPQNKKEQGLLVAPLIGMTVGALISVLAPLSQAGFNPARDFGPRLVAYLAGWTGVAFRGCWVYIVAPLIGAPLGAVFVDKVLYQNGEKIG